MNYKCFICFISFLLLACSDPVSTPAEEVQVAGKLSAIWHTSRTTISVEKAAYRSQAWARREYPDARILVTYEPPQVVIQIHAVEREQALKMQAAIRQHVAEVIAAQLSRAWDTCDECEPKGRGR